MRRAGSPAGASKHVSTTPAAVLLPQGPAAHVRHLYLLQTTGTVPDALRSIRAAFHHTTLFSQVELLVSFGGLLMKLSGDPAKLEAIEVDHNVYLLLKKL